VRKIILLLMVLMLISGCAIIQKLPGLPTPKDKGSSIIFGGSDSVDTDIAYPAEGGKIFEQYSFTPVVKLTNSGDYKKPQGQVCLSGLDSSVFKGFTGCDCQQFPQETYGEDFKWEDIEFPKYSLRLGSKTDSTTRQRQKQSSVLKKTSTANQDAQQK
jgi:hypothetical protein